MVARLMPTARLSDLLAYNEKKVSQEKATLIHAGNFLGKPERLSLEDKLSRFRDLNELNNRARLKMLHITLNFPPADLLPNDKLIAIADRYMAGLQMQDQPYLVYRHEDAAHPHIHIVSSLIRPDGSRIKTHLMGAKLSEPIRKSIEAEFHLAPNKRLGHTRAAQLTPGQKYVPNHKIPISEAMDYIISRVIQGYHFTNLQEYNAILRLHNLTVETGGPESKTRRYNGLYYVALDNKGNKISPPVMASQLACRPTQKRLEATFRRSLANNVDHLARTRRRIDLALFYEPDSLHDFATNLRESDIDLVATPRKESQPSDLVYVDLPNRTAAAGSTLGDVYTAETIYHRFSRRTVIEVHPEIQQTPALANHVELKGTEFSSRVPQPLFEALKVDFDQGEYLQGQYLGRRIGR